MTDKKAGNPAVEVAKRERGAEENETTLSSGVCVRLVPVATALIDAVRLEIKDPDVPTWYNPEKDRDEENPNDPGYLRALSEASERRAEAVMDAMILFGVELLDGIPEDDAWLKKLLFLQRLGRLDLSGFDLEDEFDLEFLYKKHVAISVQDYQKVLMTSGLTEGMVAQQAATFPGAETEPGD